MRLILLMVLALLGGYGILQINSMFPDNYVKVYLAGYVVEVNLLILLLVLFLSVLAFYIAIKLVALFFKSGSIFSNWRGRRNKNKADAKLGEGYLSLIKGDWRKAETQLTTKTKYSAVPYVNYLAAAQAAQEQGIMSQRDKYLELAYKEAPKERLAIGMTKAKLHQTAGQFEQALTTLNDVSAEGKKNAQFTAMLLQCNEQMGDWVKVQDILPLARKQHALPDSVLNELQASIDEHSLTTAQDVSFVWRALSRQQKKSLPNIELYVKRLLQDNQHTEAGKVIRSTLKSQWSEQLVNSFGQLKSDKPAKLLRVVEGWLLARPENAQLLLAAGRLAYADKKNDAAKEYLQKAVIQGQLPEAFALLGEVYEANNETGKALEFYRSGMKALANPLQADESSNTLLESDLEAEQPSEGESAEEGELIEAKK